MKKRIRMQDGWLYSGWVGQKKYLCFWITVALFYAEFQAKQWLNGK